ncbi:MAG: hypothetical protein O4861_24335 [Trichodesmium sp. St16_bin4-tuft]|nr:hypothetical protein [Trichodesmium sp. St16_bin4-tuft]MDT9339643.1 hypothetical protein [Trichodesmium erythraeum 21-75]
MATRQAVLVWAAVFIPEDSKFRRASAMKQKVPNNNARTSRPALSIEVSGGCQQKK